MKKLFFIGFLFGLLPLVLGQTTCFWKNPEDNLLYNLTGLRNNQQDYFIPKSQTTGNWDIYLNVCRGTVTNICGNDVAACQVWNPSSPTGHASLGSSSSGKFEPLKNGKKGVVVQYKQGEDGREMEIDFVCDPSVSTPQVSYLSENPVLHFRFQIISRDACPQMNCDKSSTCTQCTNDSICEWCLDSNQCISRTSNCGSYIRTPNFCPNGCSKKKNCPDCTSISTCIWCLDNNSCDELGSQCDNVINNSKFCPNK